LSVDVVADSVHLSVPVFPRQRNWSALEHGDQEECDGVTDVSAHCERWHSAR
jgi:hypothetical protein